MLRSYGPPHEPTAWRFLAGLDALFVLAGVITLVVGVPINPLVVVGMMVAGVAGAWSAWRAAKGGDTVALILVAFFASLICCVTGLLVIVARLS
jgi:hypothetical protein